MGWPVRMPNPPQLDRRTPSGAMRNAARRPRHRRQIMPAGPISPLPATGNPATRAPGLVSTRPGPEARPRPAPALPAATGTVHPNGSTPRPGRGWSRPRGLAMNQQAVPRRADEASGQAAPLVQSAPDFAPETLQPFPARGIISPPTVRRTRARTCGPRTSSAAASARRSRTMKPAGDTVAARARRRPHRFRLPRGPRLRRRRPRPAPRCPRPRQGVPGCGRAGSPCSDSTGSSSQACPRLTSVACRRALGTVSSGRNRRASGVGVIAAMAARPAAPLFCARRWATVSAWSSR